MSELVFIEQSPEPGKRLSLPPGATIGREGCDVTIPDPEMSRRQAQVLRDGDAAVIEDLGSTNGTFVNGRRISGRHTLQDGDEVRFGETVWTLQAAAAGATRIAASPVASRRGDVPPPDFQPTAIRRVVPPPNAPAAFIADSSTRGRGGSAATRVSATVFATLVTALTAAGVVIYYITEPFK